MLAWAEPSAFATGGAGVVKAEGRAGYLGVAKSLVALVVEARRTALLAKSLKTAPKRRLSSWSRAARVVAIGLCVWTHGAACAAGGAATAHCAGEAHVTVKQELLGAEMEGRVAHTEGDAASARKRKASASRMEQTPRAGAGVAVVVTRENMKRPWASRLRVGSARGGARAAAIAAAGAGMSTAARGATGAGTGAASMGAAGASTGSW